MTRYRNPSTFSMAERVLIFIFGRLAEVAWFLFCVFGMIGALVYVVAREVIKRHRNVRPAEYRSLPAPSSSPTDETVRLRCRREPMADCREHIPSGVYWSREAGNFYDEITNRGMGVAFYDAWEDRAAEFPERATSVPSPLDLYLDGEVTPLILDGREQ